MRKEGGAFFACYNDFLGLSKMLSFDILTIEYAPSFILDDGSVDF